MTQCKAVLESLNPITDDQVSWNIRNSAPTHHQIVLGQHSWSGDCVRRAGSCEDANKVSDDLL